MATPPLQLEQSVISRLLVEANPAHRPEGENRLRSRAQVVVAQAEDRPDVWQVSLDLRVVPDESQPGPYRVELLMHGFFRLPVDAPKEEATRLLGITGASILYSAAREHILMVTGRGPWGALQLPTTRFDPPTAGGQLEKIPQPARAAQARNTTPSGTRKRKIR